jgi:hypothetical protein
MKDANLVIEPNVAGFAYDCFERAPELIAAGEVAMRAVLPGVRAMLNLPQPISPTMEVALVSPSVATPEASPAA